MLVDVSCKSSSLLRLESYLHRIIITCKSDASCRATYTCAAVVAAATFGIKLRTDGVSAPAAFSQGIHVAREA